MTVKQDGTVAYIVYRDINKAKRLFNAATKNGGYLSHKTPEDAIENGEALEYHDAEVKSFTDSKFGEGTYDKIKSEY